MSVVRWTSVLIFLAYPLAASGAEAARSHPPLRVAPPPSDRPLAQGPGYYADAQKGADANDGSAAKPWKTVRHALSRLKAGDTLYLQGGTYYENVYLALRGTKDAAITIRSAPNEQAILDGGWSEFYEKPAEAWEPEMKGAPGEYRSKNLYPNQRDVIGSFGDSMIGLQTYYHAIDLRATGERVEWIDEQNQIQGDIKPLYCGPGMWYDPRTGRIHMRLAATNNPEPVPNYRGETDPRKLPLIIAPFSSTTLHVDGAEHVRLQDLVIRGGGYTTVLLDHAINFEFDNVTVWCSTYGIRASRTGPMTFHRSALYGNAAPWTYRSDTSKRDYPGKAHRNITRLNTHSLLELDAGRESSVFATPMNDHWDISYSEFTDAHDALYLGGINVNFHHNLIENMQDDGIYLSPMYFRHKLDKVDPRLLIHENVFRKMLTALAFGGTETENRDQVFIYRNLFDLRDDIPTGRPGGKRDAPGMSKGKVIGDHGSPPWSAMTIYHNTFVSSEPARDAGMVTFGATKSERPRRVFNNIYYHFARLPGYTGPLASNQAIEDGNLFWSNQAEPKVTEKFFTKFRASEEFNLSKKLHPPGSSSQSLLADPKFLKVVADPANANDYRLSKESPAVDTGVMLPEDWPDPLRKADSGKPDLGALPLNTEPFKVGRKAAH